MKTRSLFLSILGLLALAAGSAQAAIVDFTGSQYNMGTVAIGQSGTIDTYTKIAPVAVGSMNTAFQTDSVTGYLPSQSKIRFDYTLTGSSSFLNSSYLSASAIYGYSGTEGIYFYGLSSAQAPGGAVTAFGYEVGPTGNISSTPLLLVTANIIDTQRGFVTITNFGAASAQFFSAVLSSLLPSSAQTTYKVSYLPLPAALPLFGLGLAGLAGLGYRRKVKKTA